MIDSNIFAKERGECSDHLHGDDASVLIRSFEALGQYRSHFILAVYLQQHPRVMSEDT